MIKSISILLVASLILTGCGRLAESRLNPFNWFGRDRAVEAVAPVETSDPRPVVDQVIGLSIDPSPGGAIVRAVGLPATQGHFAAALVPEDSLPGILVFTFRLVPPVGPTRVSTQRSREVVAGTFLTDQALSGVRRNPRSGRTGIAIRPALGLLLELYQPH